MSDPIAPTPSPEISMEEELRQAFLAGVEEAAPSEAPAAAAPEAQPAEAKPEAKPEAQPPAAPEWTPREFSFKRNGQEVTFKPSSPEEELEFVRKGYDYTQKTMELAEEKKQLQGIAKQLLEREQARQESLKTLLTNREILARYLQSLGGDTPPTAAPAAENDEFEPVSRADLARLQAEWTQKAAEAAKAAASKEAEERFKALLSEATQERLTEDFSREIDTTIQGLRQAHPELELVDDVETLIRQAGHRAFQAQLTLGGPDRPVDPALVKAAMVEDAQRRAQSLKAKLAAREKVEAVQNAALVTKGIEPPGGNAPTAPAPSSKRFRLNDPALDAQVLAEIQSMIK